MTNQIAMIEHSARRITQDELRKQHNVMPGVIEQYDPETKTAKISIPIADMSEGDGGKLVQHDWPPLEEVPVCFPGGGGFADFFPLKAGNPCLVVFCDRDIAEWYLSDGKEPIIPADTEINNESSAICFPRLFPEGANDGEAHAKNWISWFGSGKKRVVEPNGKKVSYVVDRMNVGSEDAAKALAIAEATLSALNTLKDKVNELITVSSASGGMIPPGTVLPIIANWIIDTKKVFVSE